MQDFAAWPHSLRTDDRLLIFRARSARKRLLSPVFSILTFLLVIAYASAVPGVRQLEQAWPLWILFFPLSLVCTSYFDRLKHRGELMGAATTKPQTLEQLIKDRELTEHEAARELAWLVGHRYIEEEAGTRYAYRIARSLPGGDAATRRSLCTFSSPVLVEETSAAGRKRRARENAKLLIATAVLVVAAALWTLLFTPEVSPI